MQPLSAIDALSPAFTRTHQTLFNPFKVGRSWKLGASAYVAWIGSIFVPVPMFLAWLPLPGIEQHRGIVLALSLIPTLIFFGFFYLGVRMQFVHFEMVVTRAKFIAPMWKRYGTRIWPWILLKVVLGTVIFSAFLPAFISRGRITVEGFKTFAQYLPAPGSSPPDPAVVQTQMFEMFGHMIGLLLPIYALFFLLFCVLKLVSGLLEDFALPFYILDEVSLVESINRGSNVILRDPLQTLLFLLTKFVMSIMGFFAQYISSQILMIPFAIVGAILGIIVGFITYAMAGSAHHAAGLVAGGIVFYGIIMASALYVQIFTLGYLVTLLEAYAIYFLGGRYEKLGDYLEPPTYVYAPPPVPRSKDEDPGSGPSLPMDPALV